MDAPSKRQRIEAAPLGIQEEQLPFKLIDAVNQQFEELRCQLEGKEQRLWTNCAAILAVDSQQPGTNVTVISFATGNKCLGRQQLVLDGTLVQDCHAEVLARRGLKR